VDRRTINQADDHERSSQVAQMQHIYRLARSVVVFWVTLGPEGQNDALHLDPSLEPHIVSHRMDVSSVQLRSYLIRFFASPWWFRVWTVQEYCLASDVVFQCGNRTITDSLGLPDPPLDLLPTGSKVQRFCR
ncbi:hypothetical protein BU25DRAFT_328964, partial [Macroventuria anomochaeta]